MANARINHMAKPTLLAVDDEPEVLRAIERDLRRKFGQQYREMRSFLDENGVRHKMRAGRNRGAGPMLAA